MNSPDEFTNLVIREFQRACAAREEYTVPWLDLDVEAYRAFREGRTAILPEPFGDDPANQMMVAGIQGKQVLVLAGGGGQQSAVFSLLGAHVTVFDLMEEQLAGDRTAAAHYGYQVRTIQGNARDLSALPEAGFERVYQPISTLYIPDLPGLYAGVQRVLRPGGLYYSDYAFPLLYLAQNLGWDGQAFNLRITQPYQRGELRETQDGRIGFEEGEPIGEYHHLLSDILNGLIQAGFVLRGVWESPRPGKELRPADLPAGFDIRQVRCLPYGLSVVAEKISYP